MANARMYLQISVLLVSFISPAAAWEADVHYGLVKWLAFQAGFSLANAEVAHGLPYILLFKGAMDTRTGDMIHLLANYHPS